MITKRIVIIIVCLALTLSICIRNTVSASAYSGTPIEIGGAITEDMILDRTDAKYIMTSDINIKNGSALTICNGVFLDGNGYKINIYGELNADGACIENCNISVSNTNSMPSVLNMHQCNMSGGSLLNPTGNSAHAKIILSNNTFDGLKRYSHIWYPSEPIYITGNVFSNSGGLDIGSRYDSYITNNVFINMTTDYSICNWAQYGSQCYVEKNSFYDEGIVLKVENDNGKMIAKNNWWNTVDESVIADRIIDGRTDFSTSYLIEYLPVLTEKDEATPDYAPPEHHSERGLEYRIDGITLRDSNYQSTNSIPDTPFLVEVSVRNLSANSTDTLMIATYDDAGRMLGLSYLYSNPNIGQTFVLGTRIDNSNGEITKIKAFVVPTLGDYTPLAEAVEFSN